MSFTHQVRTAILGLPLAEAQAIQQLLERWLDPVVVREDPAEGFALMMPVRPQAVLLNAGSDPRACVQLARAMRDELPGADLVILSKVEDLRLMREALRIGARAFVVLGADEQELVRLFIAMSDEEYTDEVGGNVYTLMGTRGGVGCSTLSLNLAAAVAQNGDARVALVDLSPCLGEIGSTGEARASYSLADLVRDVHHVDDSWVQSNMPRHPWGFYQLSQPIFPNQARKSITPDDVYRAVTPLRRHFTHVLIDAGSQLTELALVAAAVSDRLLLITTKELRAMVGAQQRLALMDHRGMDMARISVAVNRVSGTVGGVQEMLGQPVVVWFSEDRKGVDAAEAAGKLLLEVAPSSRLNQELLDIGGRLLHGMIQPRQRKKFLGLF